VTGTWPCPACDTFNDPDDQSCIGCFTDRGTTNTVSGTAGGDVVQARNITNISAVSIGQINQFDGPVHVEGDFNC